MYSKRLRRFIRQQERVDGSSFIEFSIGKEQHRLPLASTIADAFLTPEQRQEIIDAVPQLDTMSLDELCRHPAIDEMADRHNLAYEAIFAVLLRAREEG